MQNLLSYCADMDVAGETVLSEVCFVFCVYFLFRFAVKRMIYYCSLVQHKWPVRWSLNFTRLPVFNGCAFLQL